MEGLDLNNILDDEDIGLFNDVDDQESTPPKSSKDDEGADEKDNNEATEFDPNGMFGDETESVGSEDKNNEEQEDTHPDKGAGTSPKSDFFSSIAEAFAEEGILPNLDEDTIKNIKTPEDFRKAIDDYIQSELSEQQQRIKEALDNNVEPDVIKQYEGVINYLSNINEDALKAENEQGEGIRKRLIFQDFINRGFSKERAEKEVNKSLSNGTDIDDAEEALKGCLAFYKGQYNALLKSAKAAKEEDEKAMKERQEGIKKSIFDSKSKFFGDLELDQATRQKVFDNLAKPIHRDPKTGEAFTAIQKYEMDHNDEFLVKLSLLFTLTDGFKSLDKLVAGKAKKEIKKGFRDLENRINNTARDSYGNLKFSSGVSDTESYLGKGIKLAL